MSNWYPKGTLEEPFLPQDISTATQLFPANVANLLPPEESIPEEFKNLNSTSPWAKLVTTWMFRGLPENTAFYGRDGINPEKAVVHLSTIMKSFGLKHEYKEAAVKFLASLWFEKVTY